MTFTLPQLPYELNGLAPHISEETLNYHYGKHHAGYIAKLNAGLESHPELAELSITELMQKAEGGLFNNAAQSFNHAFYWHSMAPNATDEELAPSERLAAALTDAFGSVDAFKEQFTNAAATHFASGWAWLVKKADGSLAVVDSHDAACPLTDGHTPLLTIDVWEHAYYIDRRNARPEYISAFWKLVNWDFVENQLFGEKEIDFVPKGA